MVKTGSARRHLHVVRPRRWLKLEVVELLVDTRSPRARVWTLLTRSIVSKHHRSTHLPCQPRCNICVSTRKSGNGHESRSQIHLGTSVSRSQIHLGTSVIPHGSRNSSTVSTLLLPHSISLAWTPSPNFPNKKSIFQTAPALILVRTAAAKT